MKDLENRISKLERHSRQWRWFSMLLVAVLACFIFVGQTRPATRDIEADHIRFRDSNGRVRMELKRDVKGEEEEFGIFLSDDKGKEIGSLQTGNNGREGIISLTTPGILRQYAELQAINITSKDPSVMGSMTPEAQEDWKAKMLARIRKLGDLNVSLGANQLMFIDSDNATPPTAIFNSFGPDGLSTTSIIVDAKGMADPGAIGDKVPGQMTVLDGRVAVVSSKTHESAILGSTELNNLRTGAAITLPVSSLTLFDKDNKVVFQAPQ